MTSRVALIQLNSSNVLADNLKAVRLWVDKAVELGGAQLICLPENFALMTDSQAEKLAHAETVGTGPIQDCLSELAREYRVTIIGGSLPMVSTDPKRVRASCLVFSPDGRCLARYDKLHLFDVDLSESERYRESDLVEPGDHVTLCQTEVGRLGLSICYDLRFAEVFRQLALNGAELISVPAAFTYVTGLAHWEVLLRTRAIETGCYILAANQTGIHPGSGAPDRRTYGHSMLITPWGEIQAFLADEVGFTMADINLDEVKRARERIPLLKHVRQLDGVSFV